MAIVPRLTTKITTPPCGWWNEYTANARIASEKPSVIRLMPKKNDVSRRRLVRARWENYRYRLPT
jgi:hypothetical protein